MKTRYYFIIPFALVAAFALVFVDFKRRHDAALERTAALEAERRRIEIICAETEKERLRHEAEARLALQIAAESTARERAEEGERKARDAMLMRRDALQAQVAQLRRDNDGITRKVAEEEALLNKAKAERSSLESERSFLASYLEQAHASAARLNTLVQRIDDAYPPPAARPNPNAP